MASPIVTAAGLRKSFDDVAAIDGVDLELERGTVTALVGPNGAGKSTLLRLLSGLLEPDEGSVIVEGIDTAAEPRRVHALYGFLPDVYGLYDEMTPRQYLLYFADAYRLAPASASSRVAELLAFVRLADAADRPAGGLSRGMRQRLGIARAMVHDPPLLLLDEPAAGLDPEARRALQSLFKEIAALGKTLVVSSHILTELEEYCTHAVLMRKGRVLAADRLDRLLAGGGPAVAVRLRVACGADEAARVLERANGVSGVERRGGEFRFHLRGEDAAAADLVARLVAAGARVASFAAERLRFEEAYHGWTAALPEDV